MEQGSRTYVRLKRPETKIDSNTQIFRGSREGKSATNCERVIGELLPHVNWGVILSKAKDLLSFRSKCPLCFEQQRHVFRS